LSNGENNEPNYPARPSVEPSYYPKVAGFGDLTDSVGSKRWWREMIIFSLGLVTTLYISGLMLSTSPSVPAYEGEPNYDALVDSAEVVAAPPISDSAKDITYADTDAGDVVKDTEESIDEAPVVSAEPKAKRAWQQTLTIKRGQTLIQTIRKAGVPSREAYASLIALGEKMDMKRLLPGQQVHLKWQEGETKTFDGLWMRSAFDKSVDVALTDGSFVANTTELAVQALTRYAEGTITDSLFMTAEREGVPPGVIVEMIRMFSFDVDFQREIRPGDSFAVYFARSLNSQFGDLRNDHIIYARLTLKQGRRKDRIIELNRFKYEQNSVGYFTNAGKSAKKALMKTPLDAAILTSSYNPNRKHPVLGYTRKHNGSDFRARTGTPIMASGDGIIERASRYGTYGNHVRIRHNSTYTTTYSHLSKYGKGIKKGARVKQGQIIGLAGATGRVTAAHLHYEVLVNGKFVNPMTLKLPTGRTLKGNELKAFNKHRDRMVVERSASQKALLDFRAAKDGVVELAKNQTSVGK